MVLEEDTASPSLRGKAPLVLSWLRVPATSPTDFESILGLSGAHEKSVGASSRSHPALHFSVFMNCIP